MLFPVDIDSLIFIKFSRRSVSSRFVISVSLALIKLKRLLPSTSETWRVPKTFRRKCRSRNCSWCHVNVSKSWKVERLVLDFIFSTMVSMKSECCLSYDPFFIFLEHKAIKLDQTWKFWVPRGKLLRAEGFEKQFLWSTNQPRNSFSGILLSMWSEVCLINATAVYCRVVRWHRCLL